MTTAYERKVDQILNTLKPCKYCGEQFIDYDELPNRFNHNRSDLIIRCSACPAAMIEESAFLESAPDDERLEKINTLVDYWNTAEPDATNNGVGFDSESQAYDRAYDNWFSNGHDDIDLHHDIDTRFNDVDNPVVRVVFRKKDGTIREMYCTNQPSMIPEHDIPEHVSSNKPWRIKNVYDLEKKAWRCFRYESVIEFE